MRGRVRRHVGVAVHREAAQEVARVVEDPVEAGHLPVDVPDAERRVARRARRRRRRSRPPCRRARRTAPGASCRSRRGRRRSGRRRRAQRRAAPRRPPSTAPVRGEPFDLLERVDRLDVVVAEVRRRPGPRSAARAGAARARGTLGPRAPSERSGCTIDERRHRLHRRPARRRPRADGDARDVCARVSTRRARRRVPALAGCSVATTRTWPPTIAAAGRAHDELRRDEDAQRLRARRRARARPRAPSRARGRAACRGRSGGRAASPERAA